MTLLIGDNNMKEKKRYFMAAIMLLIFVLTACSPKPVVTSGPLVREDFNFYDGSKILNSDDDSIYGGQTLTEGYSTARGFKYGGDLQVFADLYDGLPALVTTTDTGSKIISFADTKIAGRVNEITETNYKSVSFVFLNDGYTLTFDYSSLDIGLFVTARSPKENGRFQAFDLIDSICEYLMFGPYPETWMVVGHWPWAGDDDEIVYLNQRNDLLDMDEQTFIRDKALEYMEIYGVPLELDDERSFLSSLSDSDKDIFDAIGLKIWNWVQTNQTVGS
jgi:hypothetical protein